MGTSGSTTSAVGSSANASLGHPQYWPARDGQSRQPVFFSIDGLTGPAGPLLSGAGLATPRASVDRITPIDLRPISNWPLQQAAGAVVIFRNHDGAEGASSTCVSRAPVSAPAAISLGPVGVYLTELNAAEGLNVTSLPGDRLGRASCNTAAQDSSITHHLFMRCGGFRPLGIA